MVADVHLIEKLGGTHKSFFSGTVTDVLDISKTVPSGTRVLLIPKFSTKMFAGFAIRKKYNNVRQTDRHTDCLTERARGSKRRSSKGMKLYALRRSSSNDTIP